MSVKNFILTWSLRRTNSSVIPTESSKVSSDKHASAQSSLAFILLMSIITSHFSLSPLPNRHRSALQVSLTIAFLPLYVATRRMNMQRGQGVREAGEKKISQQPTYGIYTNFSTNLILQKRTTRSSLFMVHRHTPQSPPNRSPFLIDCNQKHVRYLSYPSPQYVLNGLHVASLTS